MARDSRKHASEAPLPDLREEWMIVAAEYDLLADVMEAMAAPGR